MTTLYINKQTEAEKDNYLFDCFHDTGLLTELVDSAYTILSGRKGSGKTAIARYLENNTHKYGVEYAHRVSIRNFNTIEVGDKRSKLNTMLFYVAIKSVKAMLSANLFDPEGLKYWKDFLLLNGLQQVSDYESFAATQKTRKNGFSFKAIASYFFARGEAVVESSGETVKERSLISKSPSSIFDSLCQTLPSNKKVIIFVDDISDYLDESSERGLQDDINCIKDLLLSLQFYNSNFFENHRDIRFVSLVREDIFEFMSGSNINKLKSDSLSLEWGEKDFASLLIKRMQYFEDNFDEYLKDPVLSLKERFPDNIFSTTLEQFSTNRFGCNFYAYMAAISFNRPRDFLQFCYALRNRISPTRPATSENIDAAEIEYADYFIQELRDELYVASRVFHYDLTQERINQLVDTLSQKNGFNASQLRMDLAHFINEKTSIGRKKIELLLSELWRYGIIGVSEKPDKIIKFKYLSYMTVFTAEKIKKYTFYLHRGLWWFAQKRKEKPTNGIT